jgi:hypothetical protein
VSYNFNIYQTSGIESGVATSFCHRTPNGCDVMDVLWRFIKVFVINNIAALKALNQFGVRVAERSVDTAFWSERLMANVDKAHTRYHQDTLSPA